MTTPKTSQTYDIAIIGAGASGSALLYTLSKYTTLKKIALVEKYDKPAQVNSKATNNSQTLHVGDIETNYSVDKVRQVYPAAMMVARYASGLPAEESSRFLFPTPKMVLAVGASEVASLEKRFDDLHPIFPDLQKLSREAITEFEPAITEGRDPKTPLLALRTTQGFAVDFEKLSQSFIDHAVAANPDIDVLFSHEVVRITKETAGTPTDDADISNNTHYVLHMKDGSTLSTRVLVVNADSYTLLLAQQLGYGKEFSLIPIGGSFYFSKKILNGKVYTVQDDKLPFAAVHGDPDINQNGETRWGPTARFHPVLEARNLKTSLDYFRSSGLLRWKTWASFAKILLDPIRFKYLLENMLYELPWIGTQMFIKNVRKIVPTMTAKDVREAKGYGGMRLQRVDTNTKELLLGEGKILGDHAIFNMTPSPGASVCLYNAMRDARTIAGFLSDETIFDEERMRAELYGDIKKPCGDVSMKTAYVS